MILLARWQLSGWSWLAPVMFGIIDCAITTEPTLATFTPMSVPVVACIPPALTGPEKVVVPILFPHMRVVCACLHVVSWRAVRHKVNLQKTVSHPPMSRGGIHRRMRSAATYTPGVPNTARGSVQPTVYLSVAL